MAEVSTNLLALLTRTSMSGVCLEILLVVRTTTLVYEALFGSDQVYVVVFWVKVEPKSTFKE